MYNIGNGYIGSPNLETSTLNMELIPNKIILYRLTLMNDQDCHISINDSDWIFIRGGQGFSTEPDDDNLHSFKIQETGITFNWIGGVA